MKFNTTSEFIYSTVAKRLKDKKNSLKLTNEKIAGWKEKKKLVKKAYIDPTGQGEDEPAVYKIVKIKTKFDPQMISRILNNNKNAPKGRTSPNPSLIPTPRNNTDNGYYGILQRNLKFESTCDMLWGTSKEKKDFIPLIFVCLITDILDMENDFSKEIKGILVDFIPYAKNQTFFEMFITQEIEMPFLPNQESYKIPAYFYGIKEDDIYEDHSLIRFEAIEYLYSKCGQEFEKIFNEFIDKRNNFKNLNRDLSDFALNSLRKMLNNYKPNENSLGLRIKTLLISDWKVQGEFIFPEIEKTSSKGIDDVRKYLIDCSLQYIQNLEDIQKLIIKNEKRKVFNEIKFFYRNHKKAKSN